MPRLQFNTRDMLWAVIVASLVCAWFIRPTGGLRQTRRELDVAIKGLGYLPVVQRETRQRGYTRQGRISISSTSELCVGRPLDSWIVVPQLTVPSDWQEVIIPPDGNVFIRQANQSSPNQIGQIQLARFINQEGLKEIVAGIYAESIESGPPQIGSPGAELGFVQQGWLELPTTTPALALPTLLPFAMLGILVLIWFEIRALRRAITNLTAKNLPLDNNSNRE